MYDSFLLEPPACLIMLAASEGPIPGIAARTSTPAAEMSALVRNPALNSFLALLRPTPRRETSSTSSSFTPYLTLMVRGRILLTASGLKM